MLNNWRSDMGKAGHGAIVDIWNDNGSMFLTPKDRADFVETSLKGMYFVYEHPDAKVNIYFIVPDYDLKAILGRTWSVLLSSHCEGVC